MSKTYKFYLLVVIFAFILTCCSSNDNGPSNSFSIKESCKIASAIGVGCGLGLKKAGGSSDCKRIILSFLQNVGADPTSLSGKFFVDEASRVCEIVKRQGVRVDIDKLEAECDRRLQLYIGNGTFRQEMARLIEKLNKVTIKD